MFHFHPTSSNIHVAETWEAGNVCVCVNASAQLSMWDAEGCGLASRPPTAVQLRSGTFRHWQNMITNSQTLAQLISLHWDVDGFDSITYSRLCTKIWPCSKEQNNEVEKWVCTLWGLLAELRRNCPFFLLKKTNEYIISAKKTYFLKKKKNLYGKMAVHQWTTLRSDAYENISLKHVGRETCFFVKRLHIPSIGVEIRCCWGYGGHLIFKTPFHFRYPLWLWLLSSRWSCSVSHVQHILLFPWVWSGVCPFPFNDVQVRIWFSTLISIPYETLCRRTVNTPLTTSHHLQSLSGADFNGGQICITRTEQMLILAHREVSWKPQGNKYQNKSETQFTRTDATVRGYAVWNEGFWGETKKIHAIPQGCRILLH